MTTEVNGDDSQTPRTTNRHGGTTRDAVLETAHFTGIDDVSASELNRVLTRATDIEPGDDETQLARATLAMLLEKSNTRACIFFKTRMTELGGRALFPGPEGIQLGHGKSLSDTTHVLGRYDDAIMVCLFGHGDLFETIEHFDAPAINDLTDGAHSYQALADLLTIREHVGDFDEVQVAWVNGGNNVDQSFVFGCTMVGISLTVATPPAYGVGDGVLKKAVELGSTLTIATDPEEAVMDADVVYTDVWISAGQEDQCRKKLQAFEGLQLNEDLLSSTDAKVMHYLPVHRDEEITGDMLEDERSLVRDQARNRLRTQKGLIAELLEK